MLFTDLIKQDRNDRYLATRFLGASLDKRLIGRRGTAIIVAVRVNDKKSLPRLDYFNALL